MALPSDENNLISSIKDCAGDMREEAGDEPIDNFTDDVITGLSDPLLSGGIRDVLNTVCLTVPLLDGLRLTTTPEEEEPC